MPAPVLCALDLEDNARRIASYSHALAEALNEPLHGVYVCEVPDSPLPSTVVSALDGAEDTLKTLLGSRAEPRPTPHVQVGVTHVQILAVADAIGAELVVMSTRARGSVLRVVLGSTAEAVIKHAARPVLVLPQGSPWNPPRSIVVAHDFEDRAGLEWVARLKLPDTQIHVLHAVGPDVDGAQSGDAISPLHRRLRAAATSRLEADLREVFGAPSERVSAHVVSHAPLPAIRGLVEQVSADLVVTGRSRRSVLSRVLGGSTGIALLRAAVIPVLIVPEGE